MLFPDKCCSVFHICTLIMADITPNKISGQRPSNNKKYLHCMTTSHQSPLFDWPPLSFLLLPATTTKTSVNLIPPSILPNFLSKKKRRIISLINHPPAHLQLNISCYFNISYKYHLLHKTFCLFVSNLLFYLFSLSLSLRFSQNFIWVVCYNLFINSYLLNITLIERVFKKKFHTSLLWFGFFV